MRSIPTPNALVYTEDMLTDASVTAIAASGFTTVIVGLFHVTKTGALYYNDTPVDDTIIATIKKLKSTSGTSVKTVLFSIGGGNWAGHPASVSDTDYPAMKATWITPASGEHNTSKENILAFMVAADLDGLDLDYEPETTSFDTSFIAQVTNEIAAKGYIMTAAPYTDMSNWETVIQQTKTSDGNNFSWWNLQLYGGADYSSWATGLDSISSSIGLSSSEIEAFLVPGYSPGSCDTIIGSEVSTIKASYPNLNGAFIWRYIDISGCVNEQATSILNALG